MTVDTSAAIEPFRSWPDPARPGVPLNPERDGWHWLIRLGWSRARPAVWWPSQKVAVGGYWDGDVLTPDDLRHTTYAGPCYMPADLAAARAEVERMREALREIAANSRDATDPELSSTASWGNYDDVFYDGARQEAFRLAQIARAALAEPQR